MRNSARFEVRGGIAIARLEASGMLRNLKNQRTSTRAITELAIAALVLIVALTYMVRGTNWAAGVGTVLGIGLWLWSARRSYREQAPEGGGQLIVDRAGDAANEERPRSSYRRLRVANAGGRPLDQVEVTLIACKPTPPWFQPLRLQRMHGGPHPFHLPPRGEVYIDLIALPHGHADFLLVPDSSRHGDVPNGIAVQPLELTVQVRALGLPKATFVFDVSRNASGALEVSARDP